MESSVDFVACDMPQANRMTIHILSAVAEGEAAAISARTKAALAAAKAQGKKLGGNRGKLTAEIRAKATRRSAEVRSAQAAQRRADLLPILDVIRNQGVISSNAIAAELNALGHTAPRGGPWSSKQVQRILEPVA
jgi:DNA invertase Pin-like site-specific DNA recombinase